MKHFIKTLFADIWAGIKYEWIHGPGPTGPTIFYYMTKRPSRPRPTNPFLLKRLEQAEKERKNEK